MSFITYAHSELNRVDESSAYRGYVIDILKVISKEGHSGCSMGVFSGMFTDWAKNPKELKGNDLFEPIWNIVKNIPYGLVDITLQTVGKLMTYTPLTHLTGEDSEWVKLDYDDGTHYQNNRMPNIFKDNDGKAYWIDGVVYYEPSNCYTSWVGLTGSFSRVYIDFPFDPATEPKRFFWTNTERTEEVKDIDPLDWLSDACNSFFNGIDPSTRRIEKDAVTLNEDEVAELMVKLYQYSQIDFKGKDHDYKRYVLVEPFYNHVLTIDKKFFSELELTESIVFSNKRVWRNWIRIIHTFNYDFTFDPSNRTIIKDGQSIEIKVYPVYSSGKHFQEFVDTNLVHVGYLPSDDEILYYDDGKILTASETKKYLFEKCKQFGFKYKNSKK